MRRLLIPVAAVVLLATLVPTQAATAEPRVGPPLSVSIYEFDVADDSGADVATDTLMVAGRQCLPLDAPASVLVTVDQFPDKVFTATPDEKGRWSVDIDIPHPVEVTYVVNASCDNYFGTTVYPQAAAGPDDVIFVSDASAAAAGGPPVPTTSPVANTGPRTTAEVEIGLVAVALGALLMWAGRRRYAGAHSR